jgi:hypothetical protein
VCVCVWRFAGVSRLCSNVRDWLSVSNRVSAFLETEHRGLGDQAEERPQSRHATDND